MSARRLLRLVLVVVVISAVREALFAWNDRRHPAQVPPAPAT